MSFLIVLRFDPAGTRPVVVREDDELFASDGATWRLVAQTDDAAEAARIVAHLRERAADSSLAGRVAAPDLPPSRQCPCC